MITQNSLESQQFGLPSHQQKAQGHQGYLQQLLTAIVLEESAR